MFPCEISARIHTKHGFCIAFNGFFSRLFLYPLKNGLRFAHFRRLFCFLQSSLHSYSLTKVIFVIRWLRHKVKTTTNTTAACLHNSKFTKKKPFFHRISPSAMEIINWVGGKKATQFQREKSNLKSESVSHHRFEWLLRLVAKIITKRNFSKHRKYRSRMTTQDTSTRRRVKLYALNADRQWDDRGTGHVTSNYVDRLKGKSRK